MDAIIGGSSLLAAALLFGLSYKYFRLAPSGSMPRLEYLGTYASLGVVLLIGFGVAFGSRYLGSVIPGLQ